MDETEAFGSIWEHIEELRHTLLRILAVIFFSILICFLYSDPIISFLKYPLDLHPSEALLNEEQLLYQRIYNSNSIAQTITLKNNSILSTDLSHKFTPLSENSYEIAPGGALIYATPIRMTHNLVVMGPLEGILLSLKTSIWTGSFLSSPLWLFLGMQFFAPGLRKHERRLILPFILTSLIFITLGCVFAFTATIPLANQYFITFNQALGVNLWSLNNYLDYTLFLLLANGIAFELGAIGVFAVHLKLISAESLIAKRRFAILGAFILSAILTPPDIFTQLMLAVPLIGLYEGLILYSRGLVLLKT